MKRWLLLLLVLCGVADAQQYASFPVFGSGTVTSITAGTGLTGGTITGSGTIALSSPVSTANGGTNAISWTAGSIPYLSNSTTFAQDNANLFWDGTNHRLGIGTNSPATTLDVDGSYTVLSATGSPINLHTAVTAHANNDTPAGIYINPTWATGGHSGVIATAARLNAVGSVVASTALELDTDGAYGVVMNMYKNGTENFRLTSNGQLVIDGAGVGSASGPDITFLTDLHSGLYSPNPSQIAISTNSVERLIVTNSVVRIENGNHLKVTGTVPTTTVNANAGTGATCTVAHATDTAGTVTLTTTGTSPASGDQCDINFAASYGVAPICQFTAANTNDATLLVSSGVYATSSTSAFSINFANTDATGHVYVINYFCIETQ